MRIALITHIRSKVGGTETYIEQLAGGLHAAGHDVALWHEHNGPEERGMIRLPAGSLSWSVESLDSRRALDGLRGWKPDVLFSHGVSTPELETEILRIGPAVQFVHAYHGACISGSKSRLSPRRMPCNRPLGAPCLLHYLPRRCGGWSPVTMARRYALETRRRDMLPAYAAVLTASTHMRAEYLKYGLAPERVHAVGLIIPLEHAAPAPTPSPDQSDAARLAREWRLLFLARLTDLKGGSLLLSALPTLHQGYRGRITLTIAGDGPERGALEGQASSIASRAPQVDVRFAGWLGAAALAETLRETDLLVVPSVWPEPFGLVGPEAGMYAVPAAAFRVGGIPDWLHDGINGHLAPGAPPTSRGLAAAIAKCLDDPGHHHTLRSGALDAARRLDVSHHVPRVVAILEQAVRRGVTGGRTS